MSARVAVEAFSQVGVLSTNLNSCGKPVIVVQDEPGKHCRPEEGPVIYRDSTFAVRVALRWEEGCVNPTLFATLFVGDSRQTLFPIGVTGRKLKVILWKKITVCQLLIYEMPEEPVSRPAGAVAEVPEALALPVAEE